MESWRKVWREGIVPQLNRLDLEVLQDALIDDDPKLLQGVTCCPAPLHAHHDWRVEAACAFGFCGWRSRMLETVGEVEEFFAAVCREVDILVGEPAGARWFLNWFDDSPRETVRTELLAEVELALASMDKTAA